MVLDFSPRTDPKTLRVLGKTYEILARNRVAVSLPDGSQHVFTTPSLSDGKVDSHLDYGGKQWLWDSSAHAMNLAYTEPEIARAELRAMMVYQTTEPSADHGFVPHMNYFKGDGRLVPEWARKHFEEFLESTDGRLVPKEKREEFLSTYWSHENYSDITQPPILAMAVLEVHQADPDRSFAEEIVPKLKAFYNYLGRRRADEDGLLRIIHPWESGWDNSQRWDEAIGVEGVERSLIDRRKIRLLSKYKALEWDLDKIVDSCDFLVKPVDFNVLYAKNMECLARLCELLGDRSGAKEYVERAERVAASIRSEMWDGDKYVDILQMPEGDRLSSVKSAATFYPMMLAGERRSRHLIHQHLANPEEFCPADGFMVSTTSLDDPTCDGSQYWRGNVWGIVNFFVHCGVREYLKSASDDDVAEEMAVRVRDSMFELLDQADFYEYFNTRKIDGEPRGYGVPSFGWNGLALFMDREPAFCSLGKTRRSRRAQRGFEIGTAPHRLKAAGVGRKWGQHFLRSRSTVEKILRAASLSEDDRVLEIGPGEGVLTLELCRQAGRVHAFEVDPALAHALRERAVDNLVIHEGDFLQQDPAACLGQDARDLVVVANLPYYITAPIVEKLCWQRSVPVAKAILMMQEEVAQRICGSASREAGALTYIAGAFFEAEYLFKVPPGCFSPPPKVDSAVIALSLRQWSFTPTDSQTAIYERVVSTAFQARRKQLTRSLRAVHPDIAQTLEAVGIDPRRRPETLEVQEFWEIARKLDSYE